MANPARIPLTRKGYGARIEFDAEDSIYFGRIAGIADIVSFHGKSLDELKGAFDTAVDQYLEISERAARLPQTPSAEGEII